MKIIDRIALNRLLKLLTDFILALAKILAPQKDSPGKPLTPPDRKPVFPWLRKNVDKILKDEG